MKRDRIQAVVRSNEKASILAVLAATGGLVWVATLFPEGSSLSTAFGVIGLATFFVGGFGQSAMTKTECGACGHRMHYETPYCENCGEANAPENAHAE